MDDAGTTGRRDGDMRACSHDATERMRWERHGDTGFGGDGSGIRRDEASSDDGAECCDDGAKHRWERDDSGEQPRNDRHRGAGRLRRSGGATEGARKLRGWFDSRPWVHGAATAR